MDVVYALEDPPETIAQSIFLAGPTPRDAETPSWRPKALTLLEEIGYDGVVFVPEDRSGIYHGNYDGQVMWEDMGLNMADIILFWVPRNMQNMPALTTNVEFGRWESSGKISFGAPVDAEKNTYLQYYVDRIGAPTATTLKELIDKTVDTISPGVPRSGGDRHIPLHLWNTNHYQRWYAALTARHRHIVDARVTWYQPRLDRQPLWAMDVVVTDAQGNFYQYPLVSQPDMTTVILFAVVNGIQHIIVDAATEMPPTAEVDMDAAALVHDLVPHDDIAVVEHGVTPLHPNNTSHQHLLSAKLTEVQWNEFVSHDSYTALSLEHLDRLPLSMQGYIVAAVTGS